MNQADSDTTPNCSLYIDGFNLYYAIRSGPNKWLDVVALADRLAPNATVTQVRYFTARVKALDDPTAQQRQQVYLRALEAVPRLSIHFGQFRRNRHILPISEDGNRALDRSGGRAGTRVPVFKLEEKGSDVNLATFLLTDAYAGAFDEAIVVTNDTDRRAGRARQQRSRSAGPDCERQPAASKQAGECG